MSETIDPQSLIDNPITRRLWFLLQAVRSQPFDRAIELARIAEAFLMETAVETITSQSGLPVREAKRQVADELAINTVPDRQIERTGLTLAEDQRDRLLQRLAEGARNAELASQFGLTAKQVQGFRMGCARKIANRRANLGAQRYDPVGRHEQSIETASIDEIVRYLRQQNDVVVSHEDGGYLVNGRFRLSAAELTLRANRMRGRQRKPASDFPVPQRSFTPSPEPNRHPLFWDDSVATNRAPNGLDQPSNPEDA